MPLIPTHHLAKAEKMLFITHLAIGDFTYLHNFFSAFSQTYPNIKIDLWVDEVRRTSDERQWPFLKKYSLYDWVEQCPFFRKIYRRTYSPELLEESIHTAQQENYPLIVSLATLRPYQYARLAREIGPTTAFIVGIKAKPRWFAPWDHVAYAKLDARFARLNKNDYHITDVYADWFKQLCDLQLDKSHHFPTLMIPEKWRNLAQRQLQEWNVSDRKIVFINPYAKTEKRCWPLTKVAELIIAMRKLPAWQNSVFIVNATPQELANASNVLNSCHLENTHLFSAEENFFQLPAMLLNCDLIISVETAVMHLANAVRVPVIALMRQKNPEWVPIDTQNSTVITTQHRREWVHSITTDQLIQALPK